ncbi:extracellular solute-binding protein [Cytobacillus horneckiae]|uniref:ABC transporter substrate-binding protein n=1 Tax=Cytobacillus horneckiae TaxID=549687 RepID=A0A2N0ZDP1_9BACI|nr:extracellular solute-binding protein [Cytobacillus horneckiae]MEC1154499.1 extracellular solute-binding protein [Cytobacillus horneckiae]MED2937834.1 extracellular solute-binding protein [Cytobacillus horneckiae]PKG27631.1 ABC transporter substrate-binding protein [Cytobacillus horneckiae]
MKKLIAILSILMLLALTACGAPTPQKAGEQASTENKESGDKTITIAGNGGVIERTIRDVIAPKYKEATGVTINYVPGLSGEILSKVELQKNAPQIDIAFFVPTDVYRAKEKDLTDVITESNVPNMKGVNKDFIAVEEAGAPVFGLAIAPAYNTEAFDKNGWGPIESWNDLVSERYEGRTAFVDITNDWGFNTLNALAMANGGGTDNVEPGIEKAKELAAYSTTFYKNSTQVMPAIQQGAADITVMGSYVIGELALSGIPLKMAVPKEGVPLQSFSATLVKNTPKEEAALEFINYLVGEEAQGLIAEQGFYPVAEGMELPEKYQESIGLKEGDATFSPDVPKFAEVRAEWSDRWNKEVVPEIGKQLK